MPHRPNIATWRRSFQYVGHPFHYLWVLADERLGEETPHHHALESPPSHPLDGQDALIPARFRSNPGAGIGQNDPANRSGWYIPIQRATMPPRDSPQMWAREISQLIQKRDQVASQLV